MFEETIYDVYLELFWIEHSVRTRSSQKVENNLMIQMLPPDCVYISFSFKSIVNIDKHWLKLVSIGND
jgi:hypothetical protein